MKEWEMAVMYYRTERTGQAQGFKPNGFYRLVGYLA
ncbi:hypothetical protein LINPERHAP1_LOCUS18283 [Linum perenne]